MSDAAGLPVYVYVPDGARNRTGDTAIRENLTMSITGKPVPETAALEAKLAANPAHRPLPGRRAAQDR